MSRTKVALFSCIIFILLLSCDLSSVAPNVAPTTDPGTAIAQAILQTQLVQTQISLAAQQTVAASGGGTLPTYTFQPTYTIQYTNTPSTVTVTVSIDTNCRTGPGSAYPIVGALVVGQVAEVVGRSAASDNWIVKLPGKTTLCWLWGQYATITGSTSGLPIVSPPATPTPETPASIVLTVYNDSSVDIYWFFFSPAGEPWGIDRLGSDTMNPGDTFSWTIPPGRYDLQAVQSDNTIYWSLINFDLFSDTYIIIP